MRRLLCDVYLSFVNMRVYGRERGTCVEENAPVLCVL